ncbi:dipeptidase [Roseateles chitinivorans]|uniref:dipeptidase n=1 Tax=Roseateles chitinivorans TaxID=2917965 RepID=UPI003D668E5F
MKPPLLPVLNALGVLDNPNRPLAPHSQPVPGDRLAMAYASSAQDVDARSLDDALASGLYAVNITLGHVAGSDDPRAATERDIAGWDAFIDTHPQLLKVRTGEDLAAARREGRIGVIYGFQNTEMLGTEVAAVDHFADLGVRVIQLTYNGRNAVGCGATVPDDDGLSAFGAEVVERLQQRRVLVDLSHSSERTCLDALRLATRPVAITHTGCRAIADHPRNKSDAELRLLAERGGVVGLYFMPYLRLGGQPHAEDLLAHLAHAIDVCGEDHVGLGTDGGSTPHDDMAAYRQHLEDEVTLRRSLGIGAPGETADVGLFLPDLCGPGQYQELARLLSVRGYRASRIEKILHGNFRRLMTETWE